MRKVLFGLACWATIGLASSRADVSYRYIADQSSYTGTAGSTVPVKLLLEETVTGTSTSIIFKDNGIFGAGVMLNSPTGAIFGSSDSNGVPQNNFRIGGNVGASPNGFGPAPTFQDFSPANAKQSGLIINADSIGGASGPNNEGVKFTSGGAGVRTALLGTVNITVGATPTTLTVTPYGTPFSTITQASTDLDFGTQQLNGYNGASLAPIFSFTVGAAIPEPSSIALCGLVACGMSYVGYRRRKTTVTEPSLS